MRAAILLAACLLALAASAGCGGADVSTDVVESPDLEAEEAYIDRMFDFMDEEYAVMESAMGGGQWDFSAGADKMRSIAGRMAAMEPPLAMEEYHSLRVASAEKCAESLSLYPAAVGGDEDAQQKSTALLDECTELLVRAEEELDRIASERGEDD